MLLLGSIFMDRLNWGGRPLGRDQLIHRFARLEEKVLLRLETSTL